MTTDYFVPGGLYRLNEDFYWVGDGIDCAGLAGIRPVGKSHLGAFIGQELPRPVRAGKEPGLRVAGHGRSRSAGWTRPRPAGPRLPQATAPMHGALV